MRKNKYGSTLGLEEKKQQKKELLRNFSVIEPQTILYHRAQDATMYQIQQTWSIARDKALQNSCKYFVFDVQGVSILPIEIGQISSEAATLLGKIFDAIIVVNTDGKLQDDIRLLAKKLDERVQLSCVSSVSEAMHFIKMKQQEKERIERKTIKLGIGRVRN